MTTEQDREQFCEHLKDIERGVRHDREAGNKPQQVPIGQGGLIEQTLAERGNNYGKFADQAVIAQQLEEVMRRYPGWLKLAPDQKEALKIITHKIARILNGNPNYADSWHDIAGYATLIVKRLNGEPV
jgi:hypothetical protein